MCKVRISNSGNNLFNPHVPSIETDIPMEVVSILEEVFKELNKNRNSSTEPIISINKV